MSIRQSTRTSRPTLKVAPPEETPTAGPSSASSPQVKGKGNGKGRGRGKAALNEDSKPAVSGSSTPRKSGRGRPKKSAGPTDPAQAGNEEQDQVKDEEEQEEDDPDRLYCTCRQPEGGRKMIQCDACEEWQVDRAEPWSGVARRELISVDDWLLRRHPLK